MTDERKRTVLVVAHAWYGDLFGGAFRVASELAIGLAASGWRVFYLCCNVGDAPDSELIQGVDVRRYRMSTGASIVPRFWQHVQCARAAAQRIASESDICAVSGHSPLQYLGALQALQTTDQRRFTYVVHSPFADEVLASSASKSVNWMLRCRAAVASMIDRWCLRRSGAVQCLSRFTVESLVGRYGLWLQNRCVECPGWVDAERFRSFADRRQSRANLPEIWHTEDPIFFTVRRLESRMGLETLISAAAEIASSHRFRILIGGSGSQASKLLEEIESNGLKDRVFLIGQIPEEQLPSCYAAADAFVLPTRSLECFGLIILEAFASGTPVIGARVGAIPEILSRVGSAWMFESGDKSGLAHCLRSFLEGRIPACANIREIALNYDIRVLLPQWIEICVGSFYDGTNPDSSEAMI